MTINVGQDFKKRWLKAPDAVRQAFLDDLSRISDLLETETQLELWLDQDNRAKQIAQLKTEQAYEDEKARLIEAARVRKQLALEKSLADKRAQQDAYNQQLIQDEYLKYQQQNESLAQLKNLIDAEINLHTQKYDQITLATDVQTTKQNSNLSKALNNDFDTIRLRLELEAETMIEDALKAFKEKLKVAADEEIKLILQNTKLDS